MADLTGLRILIVGAGKGIGGVVARMAAERGAQVVVGDLNHAAALAVAEEIQQNGGKAHAFQCDISNEQSVQNLIHQAVNAMSGLEALINMAADIQLMAAGKDSSVETMDPAVWQRTMAVNLTGFGLTTKHALPHLKSSSCASIVNISSGAATIGEPIRPAYAASKAGVGALTRHAARLLAEQKVRVNAVAPGITRTEEVGRLLEQDAMLEAYVGEIPMKRAGEMREVASVVLFLVSREASYVTGQVWGVNGGLQMRE